MVETCSTHASRKPPLSSAADNGWMGEDVRQMTKQKRKDILTSVVPGRLQDWDLRKLPKMIVGGEKSYGSPRLSI